MKTLRFILDILTFFYYNFYLYNQTIFIRIFIARYVKNLKFRRLETWQEYPINQSGTSSQRIDGSGRLNASVLLQQRSGSFPQFIDISSKLVSVSNHKYQQMLIFLLLSINYIFYIVIDCFEKKIKWF